MESARVTLSFTDFVVSARTRAFTFASAFAESSAILARSRSYDHTELPRAQCTTRPVLFHVGNSPPTVFSFFTGTEAAAGMATFTVGATAPVCATVME